MNVNRNALVDLTASDIQMVSGGRDYRLALGCAAISATLLIVGGVLAGAAFGTGPGFNCNDYPSDYNTLPPCDWTQNTGIASMWLVGIGAASCCLATLFGLVARTNKSGECWDVYEGPDMYVRIV